MTATIVTATISEPTVPCPCGTAPSLVNNIGEQEVTCVANQGGLGFKTYSANEYYFGVSFSTAENQPICTFDSMTQVPLSVEEVPSCILQVQIAAVMLDVACP